MKILHALWEKRNLGVECYEIEINQNDNLQTLKDKLPQYEADYTVIRVPAGMMEFSLYLQSVGYTFMEVMTSVYNKGEIPTLTGSQHRMVDLARYEEMDHDDINRLYDEINSGMFQQDRVSLDPNFTQTQAKKRYIGWISDEVKRDAQLFKLLYKDETAGFFILNDKGKNVCYSSLGGLYPSNRIFGFGICLNYFTIIEGCKRKAKRIETYFSTNNRGATALHLSIGYYLDQQHYVYIKHK